MDESEMVLVRSKFPVTGQPIRVVMIDGEPWFVTADVCKILGRVNPSQANRIVDPGDARVVDSRSISRPCGTFNDVSAGGKPYERGNPRLKLVDLIRRLAHRPAAAAPEPHPEPEPPTPRAGLQLCEIGSASVYGTVREIAELLRATGQLPA